MEKSLIKPLKKTEYDGFMNDLDFMNEFYKFLQGRYQRRCKLTTR